MIFNGIIKSCYLLICKFWTYHHILYKSLVSSFTHTSFSCLNWKLCIRTRHFISTHQCIPFKWNVDIPILSYFTVPETSPNAHIRFIRIFRFWCVLLKRCTELQAFSSLRSEGQLYILSKMLFSRARPRFIEYHMEK